jgi:hypothetical protein
LVKITHNSAKDAKNLYDGHPTEFFRTFKIQKNGRKTISNRFAMFNDLKIKKSRTFASELPEGIRQNG